METILFVALGLASILAALLTITSPSPIASALYLVTTLFCVAGLYVLLAAPFVAAIQIIVYAGAVIVLVLFVIMLLNLQAIEERLRTSWRVASVIVSAVILLTTFMAIMGASSAGTGMPLPEGFGQVEPISSILFSKYLYAFEVVSVLLLLAVIGAVALIRHSEGDAPRAD